MMSTTETKNGFTTKRTKSWVDPGQPLTSTLKPNWLDQRQYICVWWNQGGVEFNGLLKSGETVNTEHYKYQLINLNHALLTK